MSDDLFIAAATVDFLRELRDRSAKAIAGYDAELRTAIGARRAYLIDRIAGARRLIAAADAELERRGSHA